MAKYAVVDIGTNSARLMIAETKGKTVKSIYKNATNYSCRRRHDYSAQRSHRERCIARLIL